MSMFSYNYHEMLLNADFRVQSNNDCHVPYICLMCHAHIIILSGIFYLGLYISKLLKITNIFINCISALSDEQMQIILAS